MKTKTVFILIQEGGSTGELYIHAHDTAKDAEWDRISCSNDGAYCTSPVFEIPESLANHPDFYDVAEQLIRAAVCDLECVETEES